MSATDAAEAIKIYSENHNSIDVILLDMLMPKMNGSATIPELKKINPQVKIIGMSGSLLENLNHEMKTIMQEFPFLQKPFYSEEVVTLVNDVLSGAQKPCAVE
jgi:DNA-binding NtrC family response regulator